MKNPNRIVAGMMLATLLVGMLDIVYAGEDYVTVTPQVNCASITVAPSTVRAGNSIVRVKGSGCAVRDASQPATVIVWTPFGHSSFGYESETGALLSGMTPMNNGNFTTATQLSNAYPGVWEVYVQIWQDNQVANSGYGTLLTVIQA